MLCETTQTIAQQINSEASRKNIPISATMEITHRCNLSCYYCFVKKDTATAELSLSQWEAVLEQLAEMGTFYLTITGGEPFLRKDCLEIIRKARALNFAVSLISNGTLLDKATIDSLAALSIVDIGISLLSSDAKIHDRLSGVPGSYGAAIHSLKQCTKSGIRTICKHSLSTENFSHYTDLVALADSEGWFLEWDTTVLSQEKNSISPFALSGEQIETFYKSQSLHTPPITITGHIDKNAALHCDAGRSIAAVAPEGTIFPCLLLPISFGNVQTSSFKEIWKSSKAEQFREEEDMLLSECQSCSQNGHCSRCHGVAYHETGNWQGAASVLCRHAEAMRGIETNS